MLFSQLPPQKFWGLLEYKPQWTLTLQGWLLLFFLLVSLFIGVGLFIHPFLRMSHPIEANIMVIEGWVPDRTIKAAIAEFKEKNYRLMITTGNEIGRGKYLSDHNTFADLAAATAIALGLDPTQVVRVPNENVTINQTAASAEAVKQWLLESNLEVKSINIYSYDVHTRRSWLVFKTILAPEIEVGAIAFCPPSSRPWWKTSRGVKSVIVETIAYLYTKLIWSIER
ncbi:MAG: ElyC/SanA/YdcF family protein [Crocosphaera sp.]|nr:ElyC/SanA/YdcF family protein [Crocosphaera sp.]